MILGPRGEDVAAGFLTDRGFRIVARNYRCPLGEIDIVDFINLKYEFLFKIYKTTRKM